MRKVVDMTADDIHELYQLLRTDPHQFLQHAQEYIRRYPDDPEGYDTRADAWEVLGRFDRALEDMNTSLSHEPRPWAFRHRALIYRAMGRYQEAIKDLDRFEGMAPEEWQGSIAPLFRADCYARLGDEASALKDCDRLPHDHWTPGLHDSPAGDKDAVIEEIKKRARAARISPS